MLPRVTLDKTSSKPYYVNSKGQIVYVSISLHAWWQFKKRYEKLMGAPPSTDAERLIISEFNSACQVTRLSKWLRRRKERHGDDTLYFKKGAFLFVVQDAVIVTIEIAVNGMRHLNKYWNKPAEPETKEMPNEENN